MACLSFLSPGNHILDIFGKHIFRSFFWPDDDDDDAMRPDDATNLRLHGPSPIAPRDRIPHEGPPYLDNETKSVRLVVETHELVDALGE